MNLTEAFKKKITYLGIIIAYLSLVLIFISFYGSKIRYTQTYQHLTKYLWQAVDLEMLFLSLTSIFYVFVFVTAPATKFRALEAIKLKPKLLIILALIGAFLVSFSIILFLISNITTNNSIILFSSSINSFNFLICFGTLGLILFAFSTYPSSVIRYIRKPSWLIRLIFFIGTLPLIIFTASLIEALNLKRPAQQIVLEQTSVNQVEPTHTISVILNEYPNEIRTNENVKIETLMRITDLNNVIPGEKRYPISLNPQHQYAASANIRSVGFEIANPPEELMKPRNIEINERLNWTWFVSPKSGKEGSQQTFSNRHFHS